MTSVADLRAGEAHSSLPRPSVQYALPVLLVGAALLVTLWLEPLVERATLVLFMAAVVVSATLGGLRPGLLAMLLSLAATVLYVESPDRPGDDLNDTLVRIAAFVVASLWVSIVSERTIGYGRESEVRAGALRRSEQSYRQIVDLADEGVWLLDVDARTTYTNRRLAQILGYSTDQLRGRSLFSLVDPERVEEAQRLWRRVRAGETIWPELPLRRRDGETVWTRIACTPRVDEHGLSGAVAMVTDLSAQKHDRETLRQSESLLRAVIDGIADTVFVKDVEGRYLLVNPAGARALARTTADIIGKTDAELMPALVAEDMAEEERRILGEGVAGSFEYALGEGERRRSFAVTAAPYRDAEGRLVGLLGIARDVTERKRVEKERTSLLAEAERARREAEAANRAKDEFLATLSHELRTPLTSIVGWAKMLRSGQLDPETSARAIETIDRNARLQTQLIADVLDLSRIVSGKLRLNLRPMDLGPVIEAAIDTLRPAAEAKGIALRPALDPYPCTVSGDPDRLQQVVWNLLSNAIKFTPRGGAVEVHMRCRGNEAEVAVSDTGIGINRDLLPHVFERFRQGDASSTRRYGGLGLGLAIVRHVVELHGGRVEADSGGAGQGATFMVRLPLMEPAEGVGAAEPVDRRKPEVEIPDIPPTPALRGLKVLVVDDEPDARDLVQAILVQAGAEVATADSAVRALQRMDAFRPDVLLSDIEMPEESGYTLIRRVRERPPERGGRVPAAALTAYARLEDRTRALRSGFQMHVPKPLNPTELVTIVASLAGRLQPAS